MVKNKKLLGNVSYEVKASTAYTVCSILQRCLSFITLPLFSRLLSTEQYGMVTVYNSWNGIMSIILTLNLAYGSFSTAMIKYDDDKNGYISAVEGICLVLSVVFLAVYLPFRNTFNMLFKLPTSMMLVMVADVICTTAILLWSGKERFEFRFIGVIAVTLLVSFSAPLLAYFMVINTEFKGEARIIGYAASNIIAGGIIFIIGLLKGRKMFDRTYWSYALRFNIPLLSYYFSQVIFNQSDKIMIDHMLGKDKSAVYGVAYSFALILTFVLNAINNTYVPWFYNRIKAGETVRNRKISLSLAALLALMLLFIIWFAPEIIGIMAPEAYGEGIYVVPPVSVSLLLLFYAQFFINVEFYYEEKKSLVWASIGAAVVNLVLNWIYIRKYGFVAAAYTTLLSYIIFAFSNYLAMKKVLRSKGLADEAFDYRGLLILFTAFCGIAVWGVLIWHLLYLRIAVTLSVLAIIIAFRKKIIETIGTLKE